MPSMPLDVADAIEFAELLGFLSDWLQSYPSVVGSLARFVGSPGYGPDLLREDLARLSFLLGATDGEGLFAPGEPGFWPRHQRPGGRLRRWDTPTHFRSLSSCSPRPGPAPTPIA
jgi:hypothetical protein